MSKQDFSQHEMDDYFQNPGKGERPSAEVDVAPFDFRRLDRIPKSQLSVIHFLHEAFVRTLISSLSVYLRSFVSGSLVSVEQQPFADFVDALQSPTCIVYLTMQPYEGHSLVEINHSLLAPILDHVLGGNGKIKTELNREITDVEEAMLESFFRIIAHDLIEAWRALVSINFAVDSLERKPQLSKRIARNEAVVAISIELHVSDTVGMINLAIPSITLKMMSQRFDQQWSVRKLGSREIEEKIANRLSSRLQMDVELALLGASLNLSDLLAMKPGDVLDLGVPSDGKATVVVNGCAKFKGDLVAVDDKRSLLVESSTLTTDDLTA
jgi:flagellar motor switch protein FliM